MCHVVNFQFELRYQYNNGSNKYVEIVKLMSSITLSRFLHHISDVVTFPVVYTK